MYAIQKIGFGGGCHWCTEAVFLSLKGIVKVEQGFIAPKDNLAHFSEAVIIHFRESEISLKNLIAIHLHTHSSTSNHSMRATYRSAVYYIDAEQKRDSLVHIEELQSDFDRTIITQVIPFGAFQPSKEEFQNYYYKDTEKPFCENHISPKIG
ncbi:MAG: peptide-methionine (S)-S-oxide reductase, partial [Maribacter sp.]